MASMHSGPALFGVTADGIDVPTVTIASGGVRVEIIALGAAIRALDVDIGRGPMPRVLGLNSVADYVTHSQNMGVIAGRYANRIGGANFPLDGHMVHLEPNERTTTQLHGGPVGFGKRVWALEDHGTNHATLSLVSKAGDQGFPGRVRALCAYSIPGDGIVRIELTATTDALTVVNLAGHSYFNLDDTSSILDHRLEIPADSYTPVDDMLIPTGDIASVANTPFDFRMLRPIRQVIAGTRFGYDHNFVVARTRSAEPRLHARVIGPVSGTEMQVWSTEMGIQFYDGAYLGVPVPGLGGRMYGANAGLCLEPQYFPDTPNKPQFGDPRLSPGEEYRQVTDYRFQPA